MKKIGFIGAYDKTDLIIYLAHALEQQKMKVLVIDATTLQKTKYTIPCIMPSKCYITTYEDIDIAVGFENMLEIQNYIGTKDFTYDLVLIDIDSREMFDNFEIKNMDKNYFVTGFDNYSLKKGLEILGKDGEKILLTKILFSKHMEKEEEEYLNFIAYYYDAEWTREKIYFPFDQGDASIIVENQRNARISYKELSEQYKDGIIELFSQIAPEVRISNIKKLLKNV